MKFNYSLKQSWTFIVLFAVLVPAITVMSWYAITTYQQRLHQALTIEYYKNIGLRNQIESETQRFKTLIKNKSDAFSFLVKKHDSETFDK